MTAKRYKLILADPPWAYRVKNRSGCAETHYPTMSAKEIGALDVPRIAAKDSVLLLWTTWPKLPQGLSVLESWGFKYKTGFPWVKVSDVHRDLWKGWQAKLQYGVGYWVRGASELLLIGVRGKARPPRQNFVGLLAKRIIHSRKPADIYEYAETLPGPRIELFARKKRPGWASWGNEVESDLEIRPRAADARQEASS